MLPEAHQRRFIADHMPEADAEMTDRLIVYFRRQAGADPYMLLQPLPAGKDGAQNQIFKGLNLEAALYVASLTGSIIHVDMEAHWAQLLKDAQPGDTPSQSTWEPVRRALGEISFPVELNSQRVAESVSAPGGGSDPSVLAKQMRQARGKVERTEKGAGDSTLLPARLALHVPPAGFSRHKVQWLLVMFAGVTRPRSIPYALRLVFDEPEDDNEDTSEQNDAAGGIAGSRAGSRR